MWGPKYDIFKFTESYRNAEHHHTILLPLAMAIVILVSFFLVVNSRPSTRKAALDSERSGISVSGLDDSKSSPQKLDLQLSEELGNLAVVDPEMDQVPRIDPRQTEVPRDRVRKGVPTLVEGLPILSLPGAESRFTNWMTPEALNQHILSLNQGFTTSFWDRGHWIVAVEGRWVSNYQEFRIVYEATPEKKDFSWRYRIAQTKDVFDSNLRKLERDGYQLVQSQAFLHPDNTHRFQAVWQKLGE